MTPFTMSAPGRLCLFGEHQDYLGLPVIAMAINRRCRLAFSPMDQPRIQVSSTLLDSIADFNVDEAWDARPSDPLRHALSRLLHEFAPAELGGWHIHIDSDIPVRAGCSSSTALMTAWVAGWLHHLQGGFDRDDIVQRCHRYEVLDAGGAGGDMDQWACGHGGLNRFSVAHSPRLHLPEGAFILGDSGQPKDTQGHLSRCKDARLPLMDALDHPPVSWSTEQRALAEGTRVNRDLESEWAGRMQAGPAGGPAMGAALTRHHGILRDVLGLSTPRIEAMLDAAMKAGAWGGKINGSGGGGCLFVLAPEQHVDNVVAAMMKAGAAGAWRVNPDEGVRHD